MSDFDRQPITRLIQHGVNGAALKEDLLPLVDAELLRLAAAQMVHEKPGQTLQSAPLVHEDYMRSVGGLSIEEKALVMNLSPATVNREWQFSRAWLHREMTNIDS